jgi:hypothetical protein
MEVLMGKSSINGPFSMAMLNNQRVFQFIIENHHKNDNFSGHYQAILPHIIIIIRDHISS